MTEVLVNLYAVTGEPGHLAAGHAASTIEAFLDPLAARPRRAEGPPCQHPDAEGRRSRPRI